MAETGSDVEEPLSPEVFKVDYPDDAESAMSIASTAQSQRSPSIVHFRTGDDFDDFERLKVTALELKDQFLSMGCPVIDKFLGGGIIRTGLTELVGPGGVGKTQIALQLTLTAQLPEEDGGLNAGAIYIRTDNFPSTRLTQLCEHFKMKYGNKLPAAPLDNIIIESAFDTNALMNCLKNRLPVALSQHNIGLLIVDSIASSFRTEYENDITERVKDLRIIGRLLQDLAFEHNLVLLCLNQVKASINAENPECFEPSLGLAWRSMVNNQIVVARHKDKRLLHVSFSTYLPVRTIEFTVNAEGVSSDDPTIHDCI